MKKKPWKPTPGLIRVSSGGYDCVVKADTVPEAFRLFLDIVKPDSLGQLVEFYGLSIDDPEHLAYASCQRLLEKMGKWQA